MANATRFTRALIAGAALVGATQAMAAEPFNGPYIGAEAGWQQDKLRSSVTSPAGVVLEDANATGNSFSYGGQIGYDFKVSPIFVIGAEVQATGDTNKIRTGAVTADAGRTFNMTARGGFLVADKTLVYGKGGWTNSRISWNDGIDSVSSNRDGWLVGFGVEHMLTENISARAEYRYSEYNRLRTDVSGDDLSAKFRRNAVAVGVNYRF
jgi:outer membrane immunogenic protein